MALRKNARQETKTINVKVPIYSDLSFRLEKISKQTGLSNFNLIQKWVLQEESLLGIMLYKERMEQTAPSKRTVRQKKISGVKEQGDPAAIDPQSQAYRKALAKRVKKLKKEGMTFKKIAETFNDENISTVSGTGKWYTSSITWLLNSMKQIKR